MTTRILTLMLLAWVAAGCARTPDADPAKPEAYAVRLPLEPAADGMLQRLTLPAEALVALRRTDNGDIRVFDARGKVVPLALLDDATDHQQNSVSVPVYPIVGPASALQGSGMSIRIEGNRVARVVMIDSSPPTAQDAAPPTAVLLDTHDLIEPANAIELDADIPADQPVTLTLRSSANLKDWKPLADKVLFRPTDGPAMLSGSRVSLPGVNLHGRYVGITWEDSKGVALRAARVITSTVAPPLRIAAGTSAISLADSHELRFGLPSMARLAAFRLTLTGSDGVIPAKLYGRDQQEDPWSLIAAATLRPGAEGNVLDLSGSPMASYRLKADGRTGGFSAAPKLELLFDPVDLLIALSGTPPYQLAAGQAAAPDSYLTLAEIAPQSDPAKLADLPQASLTIADQSSPVITLQAGSSEGAFEPRKLVLWAALILGTLVLAIAAVRLLRAANSSAPAKDK